MWKIQISKTFTKPCKFKSIIGLIYSEITRLGWFESGKEEIKAQYKQILTTNNSNEYLIECKYLSTNNDIISKYTIYSKYTNLTTYFNLWLSMLAPSPVHIDFRSLPRLMFDPILFNHDRRFSHFTC